MSINTFLQKTYPQDVNMVLLAGETQNSEIHKFQMSNYSSKLKCLLNKKVDKDKLNGIWRVHMQLSYSWSNSFVKKNQWSEIRLFTKIEWLAILTAQWGGMNVIGRLYIQLSYSWLHKFFRKKISGVLWFIYSPKLKGLLCKRVDKDKMNGIGRLYM